MKPAIRSSNIQLGRRRTFFSELFALVVVVVVFHAKMPTVAATATVTYSTESSRTAFPLSSNPERGFYWLDTYYASYPERLRVPDLISKRNLGLTVLLRLYYLDAFLNSDISQDFLDDATADFAAMAVFTII